MLPNSPLWAMCTHELYKLKMQEALCILLSLGAWAMACPLYCSQFPCHHCNLHVNNLLTETDM